MANNYQILSEDAIKYLCGLIRDLASVSEGIDNINLADDKTFSNIYIKNLIDKCLEDANAEAEKLVGALTHLTCEETAIQPTLDNSEINVIYLYSANGNPPYQQFLKISEDKLVDLGSTSISLEDYIKAADIAKDYATKVELKAVTDKIGTTTLTTTDTTITGAIEEVKGIVEGKAEILDSEKNDVNTWSSKKTSDEIAKVETELKGNIEELSSNLVEKVDYKVVVEDGTRYVEDIVTQDINTWLPNNNSSILINLKKANGANYSNFQLLCNKQDSENWSCIVNGAANELWKIRYIDGVRYIDELATMDKFINYTKNIKIGETEDVDANNLKSNANYIFPEGYEGNVSNMPSWIKRGGGLLECKSWGTYETQVFYPYGEGIVYIRSFYYYDNKFQWSDWKEIATMDKVAHEVDTSYMSGGMLNISLIRQSLGVGCYEIMGQGSAGHGSIRLNIWQVVSGSIAFSCCITDSNGVKSICSNEGDSTTVDVGTSYFSTTNKIIKIF